MGIKAVILFEGINDIMYDTPPGSTPVTSWTLRVNYQAFVSQARTAGVKVYGAPLTPFKGFGSCTDAGVATRQALNT